MKMGPHGESEQVTYYEIKSAAIDHADSGDNTIVAAVVGKRILVFAYALQAVGTVNAKFTDGLAGDGLTGDFNFQAREGIAPPGVNPPAFMFGTTRGNALVLNLSAGVAVKGHVSYMEY